MGSSVISVGTRHVKVWRLEHAESISPTKGRADALRGLEMPPSSPVPKALAGRNCLLGSLMDAVFTTVVAIANEKAILCTENGDICLLDDTDQNQRIERLTRVDFRILCVSVCKLQDTIVVAGSEGRFKIISMDELEAYEDTTTSTKISITSNPRADNAPRPLPDILAVGFLGQHRLVMMDASHTMFLKDAQNLDDNDQATILKQIPAHDSPILGVNALQRPNKRDADFLTWSSQGTALFWALDGTCMGKLDLLFSQEVSISDNDPNELKVVRASLNLDCLIFGDKYGNIGLSLKSNRPLRAHDGEVSDICITQQDDGSGLVASCGRDRALQLFHFESGVLRHLQTMDDDHAASVSSVAFLDDGSTLMSASADRTVVIRTIATVKERMAAIPVKVLTLKSSPVAFAPMPREPEKLVISTMDRQILYFNMRSGQLLQSYKATDVACRESVMISSMVVQVLNDEAIQAPVIFGCVFSRPNFPFCRLMWNDSLRLSPRRKADSRYFC